MLNNHFYLLLPLAKGLVEVGVFSFSTSSSSCFGIFLAG
jgi:hypothetical protein